MDIVLSTDGDIERLLGIQRLSEMEETKAEMFSCVAEVGAKVSKYYEDKNRTLEIVCWNPGFWQLHCSWRRDRK
jgi:hypothetical protein